MLDRVIEMLYEERREKFPPLSESEKPQYFRALCNLRMPNPATEEFIKLQDEYLSEQTQRRGIVDIE